MKRHWISFFACAWALCWAVSPACGQKKTCQTSDTGVANVLKYVEGNVKAAPGDTHVLDQLLGYAYWEGENAKVANAASGAGASAKKGSATAAPAATPAASPAAAAAAATQARTDEQTTASSGAAGSTSTTSKGSVPWLLGMAEEYGGLTQSVSGSTATVNGNVANIGKALSKKQYQKAFDAGADNAFVASVSKASFSMSFNTGSSSSSTQSSISPSSFCSATAHIDMYNHRDPRYKGYIADWQDLVNTSGATLAGAAGEYGDLMQKKSTTGLDTAESEALTKWHQSASKTISGLVTYLSTTKDAQADQDKKVTSDIQSIWSGFNSSVCSLNAKYPDLKDADAKVQSTLKDYTTKKDDIVAKINKSPVLSFEYTFTNQSSVALPKSTTQTYAIGTTAPDLSNFNLIFQAPLARRGSDQITVNAGATLYTAPSAQLHLNPVRDFKVTAEADFALPSFDKLAKSTLSICGLVQDLLQEPLGQKVTVNGVSVTNTGNIVLGQVKWTFPAGSSGIAFPISFTASNRTDLIKETMTKATIGVSYNLDSLFAQTAK